MVFALQADAEPVPVGLDPGSLVSKQCRAAVDVGHDQIWPTIIVQIAVGQSSSRCGSPEGRSRCLADIGECPLSLPFDIVKQESRLFDRRTLRVPKYVPVDDNQVFPTIVVHINKSGTPADIRARQSRKTARKRVVKEDLLAEVPIQAVQFRLKVRYH